MPVIIPSSFAFTGAAEGFTLDGLDINDGVTLTVESATHVPAPKKPEWIGGANSNGALLARHPKHENCVWEIRLRVEQQATMDAALAHIAAIEDKLQECSRNTNGLALVWDPANSTLDPVTWRCLLGEITERPIDMENGWLVQTPVLGIRLTCLPLGLGTRVLAGTVTTDTPLVTLELEDIAGDEDALGELVVTDDASQHRRYVAWGLESRWYDGSTSLTVDSASMVTTGYTGVTATRSGAYGGATNNVISATLRTQLQGICGLGDLSHIGVFRPQLRFWASATTVVLYLKYQVGDGPMRRRDLKVPVVAGWNYLDLGTITVPEAILGTQKWTGRIEAYSTAIGGETLDVDVMHLLPAEQTGRAYASFSYQPGVLTAYDDFAGTTSGGALSGRTPPIGAAWVTAGAGTDFAFVDDYPLSGDEAITRTTNDGSTRLAVFGSSVADCEVAVTNRIAGATTFADSIELGVVARYTNTSNYVRATFEPNGFGSRLFQVIVRIAGVETIVATHDFGQFGGTLNGITRLIVRADGTYKASRFAITGELAWELAGRHTSLASAGALATGKAGIYDRSSGIGTRYYDEPYAATPAAEPMVCYADRSIEFRHDGTEREDPTGVFGGTPPVYLGPSSFTVPNAGGPARKTRIAVIARRNDVTAAADDDLVSNATMDSTTVAVYVTPRYLAVPRAS